MNFYMPAKVFSEENCVQSHSAELASLGSRALIVTGKSSARRCGAFADVTAALKKHGVTWVEFAEVEENPSVETVMKARDLGCLEKTDFVIGIGGGSPMDAAKAVALMIRHADHDWTYMYDKSAETSTIPLERRLTRQSPVDRSWAKMEHSAPVVETSSLTMPSTSLPTPPKACMAK